MSQLILRAKGRLPRCLLLPGSALRLSRAQLSSIPHGLGRRFLSLSAFSLPRVPPSSILRALRCLLLPGSALRLPRAQCSSIPRALRCLLLFLAGLSVSGLTPAFPAAPATVPPAAAIQGPGLDSPAVLLEPRPETYTFVVFWASWCPGCMNEMPSLVALHRQIRGKKVEFLSVSLDYRRELARETVARMGIEFPVIFSGRGWNDPLVERFQVESIPHHLVLDGDLTVIARSTSGTPLQQLIEALAAGDRAAADAVLRRAAAEQAALAAISRHLRLGNTSAARSTMQQFLEQYPDSEQAPEIRNMLMSQDLSGDSLRSRPAPADLKPPDLDLPPEVFVPRSGAGEPAKVTCEYLRHLARALEAYHQDRGIYPTTLRELLRDRAYLSDIPPDPYGGELRYRTDGDGYWILAGNGPDRTADAKIETFRGDPAVLEGTIYRETETGESAPGDVIAYRATAIRPEKTE